MQLLAWRYPIVCDTLTGTSFFDHFEGMWGAPKQPGRFLQTYAIEKRRLEARTARHTIIEQALPDRFIKLPIQVGAAA